MSLDTRHDEVGEAFRFSAVVQAKDVRTLAIEIAWAWVRYQPDSALTRRYQARFGQWGGRQRRFGIVALARRLLVELWRYLETGALPAGAVLKGRSDPSTVCSVYVPAMSSGPSESPHAIPSATVAANTSLRVCVNIPAVAEGRTDSPMRSGRQLRAQMKATGLTKSREGSPLRLAAAQPSRVTSPPVSRCAADLVARPCEPPTYLQRLVSGTGVTGVELDGYPPVSAV